MSDEYVPERLAVAVPTLQEVARRRYWQALGQSLGIDVAVAVALVVLAQADTITDLDALGILGFSVAKSGLIAVCQWIVRRFVDKSGYNRDGSPRTEGGVS